MTKTEELLRELCNTCNQCFESTVEKCTYLRLKEHLAPLIAKERIVVKLREYEPKLSKKPFIAAIDKKGNLHVTIDVLKSHNLHLYSGYGVWMRLIKEEPDLVKTAFCWNELLDS